MTPPIEIRLTYDSLIALLQGKELHLQTTDKEFIFYPPFNGVFVTHKELAEMKARDTMGVLKFLELIRVQKEKEEK